MKEKEPQRSIERREMPPAQGKSTYVSYVVLELEILS